MNNDRNWLVRENTFDPADLNHKETIFTIGNGYLCTRGALEETYPGNQRATFIHGVFDAAPIILTELANAPDWLPLTIHLNDERFALDRGTIESFERVLDLRTGVLTRRVRWRSPSDYVATMIFERFTSLADEHTLFLRCRVTPEFDGTLEIRAGLDARMDNRGMIHWRWMDQGERDGAVYLRAATLESKIETAYALRINVVEGAEIKRDFWDVENSPTLTTTLRAVPNEELIFEKYISVFTSRDLPRDQIEFAAMQRAPTMPSWEQAHEANANAWAQEWARSDVVIEGDDEAQLAIRFNLFQLLIAAPRHDDRVNIGAKTLSGFGYNGHCFWDTEIFMLPLFIYTAPHLAKNLLNYRFHNLPGAHRKAQTNGYEGAQFPWESAGGGDEVTPPFVPHFADPTKLVRIWPGEIEIHISADIAYAAYHYWRVTGDDEWLIERGAELILDTAKFWAARAEWSAEKQSYEYNNVIGPDENHDHVNNNFYTNRMAQSNLQTALQILALLEAREDARAQLTELIQKLDLSSERLEHWREVIEKIYLPLTDTKLIEQFEGYFKLRDVKMVELEPRDKSLQQVFGIEGANEIQGIKQPDVLMLLYLLRDRYSDEIVRENYEYYTPRTDVSFGSSLGPSIQAIIACEMGDIETAYDEFIRAARADLRDVRGNANDGIHAASAGGTWQAIVFGFAGLRVTENGWTVHPRLPKHWRRLAFRFFHRGEQEQVDLSQ